MLLVVAEEDWARNEGAELDADSDDDVDVEASPPTVTLPRLDEVDRKRAVFAICAAGCWRRELDILPGRSFDLE